MGNGGEGSPKLKVLSTAEHTLIFLKYLRESLEVGGGRVRFKVRVPQ